MQCNDPCDEDAQSALNQSGTVIVDPFFTEYNRLVQWYQELPSGMFISKLICEYRSSEPDLEATRQLFYEAVKSYEDFPYGLNTELKRRVYTRKGDPPVNKLANDIYILLSIFDGADYSDMKEMLSNGKPKSRSFSTGRVRLQTLSAHTPTNNRTENEDSKTPSVINAAEFKMLKDTLSQVQADVLNMKQSALAAEKVRSDQMKIITSTVESIKNDLHECNRSIANYIQKSVNTISNDKIIDIKPLEDKINSTESRVQKLENFLDQSKLLTVEKLATAFYGGKSRSDADNTHSLNSAPQHPAVAKSCMQRPVSNRPHPMPPPVLPPPSIPPFPPRYSPPPIFMWQLPVSSPYVGTPTQQSKTATDRNVATVVNNTEINSCLLNVATNSQSVLKSDTSATGNSTPKPIPVRVTVHEESSTKDGFTKKVRRKPKKLFIWGYSTSVSTDDIYKIVHDNGSVVRNISIFPSKKQLIRQLFACALLTIRRLIGC